MNEDNFTRLESKVDILTGAINRLVLFEERQSIQALSISDLQARIRGAEDRLQQWINRGVGAWAIVSLVAFLYQALK